jgi:hypothetical protein
MSPCIERTTQISSQFPTDTGRDPILRCRFAALLERALGAENARIRIDVLILHIAKFRRALLPVQLVQQRLRVEGLQMRRSAGHEQEDHRLRGRVAPASAAAWGASGLNRAARACSCAIMEANASEPAPQKQLVRNSRRFRLYRMCSGISVHV